MIRNRFILSIALCFIAGISYAQSVSFINTSSDARTVAMGDAGYAMPVTAFATHYNSAGVLFSNRAAIGASYVMWQPDASDNSMVNLGGYCRFSDKFGMAAGVRHNTLSDIFRTDEQGNPLGNFTPTEYMIDLGIAYRVAKHLGIATTFRYIDSDLGASSSGSAFAVDIDLMYKLERLSIGLGLSNLGSKIDYGYDKYELPARIKAGAMYQFSFSEKHHLTGSAELDYQLQPSDFSGINAGVGVEYAYKSLFALRGGYHIGDEDKTGPSYASLGCGVNYAGFSLDFAYLLGDSASAMKNTMLIALSWRLR
ncbi:PorV/PorQ family protein [Porphyromonadaceae bacterium OttesenSCG-928-L07]|nr:PorV/PorQ family protein [Porphyromonadaceae bacterium OttesenSCG-928-L07]MDL2251989.1 PorV/PorQ family protein [Odoribacter sp. OttesenSCG-928-J03]MDL2330821.1 PorV/PorQ family protein [Odoribacter sp. OttesenSCG-928-A06]